MHMRHLMNLSEVVSGHEPRQLELYPTSVDVQAERVATMLAATPYFSSFVGNYAKSHVTANILTHVAGFFNDMWENAKYVSYPDALASLADVWPYTGPCYRIIGVSLSRMPIEKITKYPALKAMLLGRFDAKDERAKREFFQYLTHDVRFQDHESWSKSLDGIAFFNTKRYFHTRNVIYKAKMQRGLDFQAMAQTLHDIGLLKSSERLISTIGVQEVIGAVANPVPLRWKLTKWFREDFPADMVIDGKKYRWTIKGTLERVPPARR